MNKLLITKRKVDGKQLPVSIWMLTEDLKRCKLLWIHYGSNEMLREWGDVTVISDWFPKYRPSSELLDLDESTCNDVVNRYLEMLI